MICESYLSALRASGRQLQQQWMELAAHVFVCNDGSHVCDDEWDLARLVATKPAVMLLMVLL